MKPAPLYTKLYLQVIVGILIGVLLGYFYPETGASMKPLGDSFIKLIKMMIAPIIFCTVVTGISKMGNLKDVGRVGSKALLYFEVVTTLAMAIGMLVVNLVQPGAGMNIDAHALDTKSIAAYTAMAQHSGTVEFLMNSEHDI